MSTCHFKKKQKFIGASFLLNRFSSNKPDSEWNNQKLWHSGWSVSLDSRKFSLSLHLRYGKQVKWVALQVLWVLEKLIWISRGIKVSHHSFLLQRFHRFKMVLVTFNVEFDVGNNIDWAYPAFKIQALVSALFLSIIWVINETLQCYRTIEIKEAWLWL